MAQEGWQVIVKDLLEILRKVTPSARMVVAGGFVRDNLLGRTPKDIDVFVEDVPRDLFEWGDGLSSQLKELAISDPLGSPPNFISNYCEMDKQLTDVASIGKFRGYPVQLIGLPPAPGSDWFSVVLDRIDFGVCRAGHDGDSVKFRQDFIDDVAYRRFTLLSKHTIDRSKERFERLKAKYPEFTLVIPE